MRLVVSGLANWQQWLWALNVGAQAGLCYLIVRRGTYKCLSFLFFYLISDLGRSAVIFASYQHWGYSSWASYIVAWSSQAVVVAARGMAVAEVCKNCLQEYKGIWALGWRILAGAGAVVVSYAAVVTLVAKNKSFLLAVARTVLAADRGLELALIAVLLSLLVFARYYRVPLGRPHKALAVGFGLFSSVAVLNDSVLSVFLRRYISVWNGIETSSYFVVLVVWLRVFYKLVPAPSPVPVLIPQTLYQELAPRFNYRLRLLNDRLMGMLKS
jgi:hypothetical protein